MLVGTEQGKLVVAAAGRADVGRKRAHNEDSILVRPDLGLFLVADGAGGHAAGEVASRMCVGVIAEFFEATQAEWSTKPAYDDFGLSTGERRLSRAVKKANHAIVEAAGASRQHKGMGTTVVAASVSPASGLVHVAHVGDSRCYRLRGGYLECMTQDHSLMQDILELRPDLDDEALAKVPSNVITRALGADANVRVSVHSRRLDASDRYLLCSDGLWGSLSGNELARWLSEARTPEHAVETLIASANAAGGDDNIGAVVFFCGGKNVSSPVPSRPKPGRAPRPSGKNNREESVPEILVLGIEEMDLPAAGTPQSHERSKPAPPPADPVTTVSIDVEPEVDICRVCQSRFDTEFCPFCGTRRERAP
jgi:protein phosphatase